MAWMTLENSMLGERSQTQKVTCEMSRIGKSIETGPAGFLVPEGALGELLLKIFLTSLLFFFLPLATASPFFSPPLSFSSHSFSLLCATCFPISLLLPFSPSFPCSSPPPLHKKKQLQFFLFLPCKKILQGRWISVGEDLVSLAVPFNQNLLGKDSRLQAVLR